MTDKEMQIYIDCLEDFNKTVDKLGLIRVSESIAINPKNGRVKETVICPTRTAEEKAFVEYFNHCSDIPQSPTFIDYCFTIDKKPSDFISRVLSFYTTKLTTKEFIKRFYNADIMTFLSENPAKYKNDDVEQICLNHEDVYVVESNKYLNNTALLYSRLTNMLKQAGYKPEFITPDTTFT